MKQTYHIELGGMKVAIADVSYNTEYYAYEIHRINVPSPFRRKGYGTRLLKMITDDADREGANLWLVAVSSGEMLRSELIAWYKRHGFEYNVIDDTMRRYPVGNADKYGYVDENDDIHYLGGKLIAGEDF